MNCKAGQQTSLLGQSFVVGVSLYISKLTHPRLHIIGHRIQDLAQDGNRDIVGSFLLDDPYPLRLCRIHVSWAQILALSTRAALPSDIVVDDVVSAPILLIARAMCRPSGNFDHSRHVICLLFSCSLCFSTLPAFALAKSSLQ